MATSNYASTPETTNANRASRILLGPCTDQLRDVLRRCIPPANFHHVITHSKSNLSRLSKPQRNLILPRTGHYSGDYCDMDISLLYFLLRNFCNIPPHTTGWGRTPASSDTSLSASIDRIREARNGVVHSSRAILPQSDFNDLLGKIKMAVISMDSYLRNSNEYEKAVDFLLTETMDPEQEQFTEQLRKQVEEDRLTMERFEQLENRAQEYGRQIDDHDRQIDDHGRQIDDHGRQIGDHDKQIYDYGRQIDDYGRQIDDHGRQIGDHGRQIDDHDRQIYDYGRQIDDHGRKIDDHGRQIGDHGRQIGDHGRQIDDHGRQIDDHGRQIDDHGRQIDDHGRQIDDHGRQIDDHDRQIYDYGRQIDDHGRQIGDHDRQIGDHGRQIGDHGRQIDDHGRQIDDHGRQIDDHGRQIGDHGRQIDDHGRQIDDHGRHIDDHGRQIGDYGRQIDDHGRQIDDHGRQIDDHGRQIDDHGRQIDDHGRQIGDYGRQIDDHGRQIDDYGRQIADIKQKIPNEKLPESQLDINEMKQTLLEINHDTTKVIPLSPLQERGENELPIELLYASVVIRKDLNYAEKGRNFDTGSLSEFHSQAQSRTKSKLDTIINVFKRIPGLLSSKGANEGKFQDVTEVTDPANIFPPQGRVARDVYLLGDAAHGKTTYCLWILKKWCDAWMGKMRLDKWGKAIKEFDFVFLLQLRHMNPNRASVIDMICQDVFMRNKNCHAAIRHVLSSDRYRSLIILDGLDEWNPSDEARNELTCQGMPNIEDLSCTVSCFISMRPWVFHLISKNLKVRDNVIEIQGLSETGMMNVIDNVLIHHYRLKKDSLKYTRTYEKIVNHLKETSLKSFMQIPLLAVVCVQIWCEGKQVGGSMTSFYVEMLNMLIERENHKREVRIEVEEMKDCEVPEILSKKMKIKESVSILIKLGKIAYEGLVSNVTNLVFQKIELEVEIGVEELQFALDVGLISKKEARSVTEKNVSVHFFHKSIQEFLAAIYITSNKEVSSSFCEHLCDIEVIMELSNVILFICGMCPSLGSVISQRIVNVTDNDRAICEYRESTDYNYTVEELYKLQVCWSRELQFGQTNSHDTDGPMRDTPVTERTNTDIQETDSPRTDSTVAYSPMTFHVSDVYLRFDSNIETVTVTRAIMSDHHVNIRSLGLQRVPTDGERGITNTELNNYLCNTHLTRSLVKAYIYGHDTDRCVDMISGPTLKCFHLSHVAIQDSGALHRPLISQCDELKVLYLSGVTLGDRDLGLTSRMTMLQKVELDKVKMKEAGWGRWLQSVISIQHQFDVVLTDTNIDRHTESTILSSPHIYVKWDVEDVLVDPELEFTRLWPLTQDTQ